MVRVPGGGAGATGSFAAGAGIAEEVAETDHVAGDGDGVAQRRRRFGAAAGEAGEHEQQGAGAKSRSCCIHDRYGYWIWLRVDIIWSEVWITFEFIS